MPTRAPEQLVQTVARDFPDAAQILVSNPDRWQLIDATRREDLPLYTARLPAQVERPHADHFPGLSAEVNRTLDRYRHYRLFEPWPTPILSVSWQMDRGHGRVAGMKRLDVRLHPIAEAQAWTGIRYGVLWECYLLNARRQEQGHPELVSFWQAVERDMNVDTIFILPHEPAFQGDYTAFLGELGYGPDRDFPEWWSKRR
jgi:hypothetical protein